MADFNGNGWPDVVLSNTYGIARLSNVPVPTVSPASLTWPASGVQKVTIKNTLSTSQAIQAAVAGATESSFKITGNTCGVSLAPGATCTISVEFISRESNKCFGRAVRPLELRLYCADCAVRLLTNTRFDGARWRTSQRASIGLRFDLRRAVWDMRPGLRLISLNIAFPNAASPRTSAEMIGNGEVFPLPTAAG